MKRLLLFLVLTIVASAQYFPPSGGGGGGGTGDVVGPSSATDTAITIYDSTTGKLIKDSGCTINSSNVVSCPGGANFGTGSGKTGYELFTGKTSGSAGFTVADAAGTQILYMLPTSTGSTNYVLADSGSATCPDMASGAPTNCHQLVWNAPASGAAGVAPSAFGSLPSCTTTAAAYLLTNSYYEMAYCDGSSTYHYYMDGKEITLPGAASGWTLVTAGSAAKADSVGGVNLSTTNGTVNMEGLVKAVPSAPYDLKLVLSAYGGSLANNALQNIVCGVYWADGTATSSSIDMIRPENYGGTNPQSQLMVASSFTSYAFAAPGNTTVFYGAQFNFQKLYLRLKDDNTNRLMYVSNDGVNWVLLRSIARATPFTPTHYGFACGAEATGDPWTVTLLGTL